MYRLRGAHAVMQHSIDEKQKSNLQKKPLTSTLLLRIRSAVLWASLCKILIRSCYLKTTLKAERLQSFLTRAIEGSVMVRKPYFRIAKLFCCSAQVTNRNQIAISRPNGQFEGCTLIAKTIS